MYKFFLSVAVVCTFIACKSKKEAPKPTPTPVATVDVIIATPQSMNNVIEVNGTILAGEFVELRPEVAGRLTYLQVPEGGNISKGTVLARINDADLQAQLNKIKVQLDLAKKTEERYGKLLAVHGLNEADYDAALNQVNSFKADLVYTQALIDKTIIKAPFSGIVGLRQVSPGAYVSSANVITTIQQVTSLKIDFTIPEIYANILRKGNTLEVVVDNTSNKKQKATIIAVEPQANTGTRNLKVRAQLNDLHANPGGFVKVYLNVAADKKAILVPTNALIASDKNSQAIVVKNGKANFVTVNTGTREESLIEITKGINPGDSVVVTGVLFARPKNAVKIKSVKQLKDVAQQ